MTELFETVLNQYESLWLDALDKLATPFPFAAVCLASICLDHLGNAIREDLGKLEEHASVYDSYIRKYLGPRYQKDEAFPDDPEMRSRFYAVLRCGLVHAARTDDHRKETAEAAPVLISHEDFVPTPCKSWEDMCISVPWLIRCVKRAWKKLRSETDAAKRERVTARLQMVVRDASQPTPPHEGEATLAEGVSGVFTSTAAASGTGTNFGSKTLEDTAYERELSQRYGIDLND